MRIEIVQPEDFARRAADIFIDAVRRKPDAVLGLPTGSTPLGLYEELSRSAALGAVDFSRAAAFAIDELHGIPRDHPATNASYLARALAGLPLRELNVMDSAAGDAHVECGRFGALLAAAGGLDLLVLGIGKNGHIAFNEPGSAFESHPRRVRLEQATREPYARYFSSLDATPEFGLTLGMAELLAAREVLLLATGAGKAAIAARALEDPVSEDVPASALQRHKNATVLLDSAAAAELDHGAS